MIRTFPNPGRTPGWWARWLAFVMLATTTSLPGNAQTPLELQDRRARLASSLPAGLVILPGRIEEKAMEQPAWIQDPSFQYYTGLHTIPGGILVIDTAAGHDILFSGGAPLSFGMPQDTLDIQNRPDLIEASGLDAVLPMDRFIPWVENRLTRIGPDASLFVNEPRQPAQQVLPDGMPPVSGWHALWRHSLSTTFPQAEIRSAADVIIQARWQKSAFEIARLRRNGEASAVALKAGMHAVEAGMLQRTAEAAVVASCLESGMEGPSFWPWVMTGPNAHLGAVVRSFYDYEHLNRTFRSGELVRVDIGCMSGGYGGDVGRTIPVSGRFTPAQGRIWDLLVTGYQAGVAAMQPGVSLDDVAAASRSAIVARRGQSPDLDEAIDRLTAPDGVIWHIHGVGIESGETPGDLLVEGAVLAFEPMISVGQHAYYLEDMWLITASGAVNLTPGLPTTREEIETFLSR